MTESPARFPHGATLITPASFAAVYIGQRARSSGSGDPSSWPPAYIPHPICGGRAPFRAMSEPNRFWRFERASAVRSAVDTANLSHQTCTIDCAIRENYSYTVETRNGLLAHPSALCRYGLGPHPSGRRLPHLPYHHRRARTFPRRLDRAHEKRPGSEVRPDIGAGNWLKRSEKTRAPVHS